jgi:subtilisin-like proprotein convertase family protein
MKVRVFSSSLMVVIVLAIFVSPNAVTQAPDSNEADTQAQGWDEPRLKGPVGVGPTRARMPAYEHEYEWTGWMPIPDDSCPAVTIIPLTVPDAFDISDVHVGFNAVHAWRDDVRLWVVSPMGTAVYLLDGTDGGSANNFDVRFDDSGGPVDTTNHDVAAPFYENVWAPVVPLATLAGENAQGIWQLRVCDDSVPDDGNALRWALFFDALKPDIDIEPLSFHSTQCSEEQVTLELSVSNLGEMPLNWSVKEMTPTLGLRASGIAAPTDMGYAHDIGLESDNFVSFVLNDFPGQTVLGQQTLDLFGYDFDSAGVLYALEDTTQQLGTVDLTDGSFTVIGPSVPLSGHTWSGLTVDPRNDVFYASSSNGANGAIYRVDPSTGAATLIGQDPTVSLLIDIAMNPAGDMYGHDVGTDSIYQIDPTTGLATLIGPTGYNANFAQGMDFDNDDGTLYIFLYQGGGSNVYGTVDLATGAVTPLAVDDPLGEFEGAIPPTVVFPDIPWVSEVPATGLVLPGECMTVAVTFDSSGLDAGDYEAELVFRSDDPLEPEVIVPVSMTVRHCAEIDVEPEALESSQAPGVAVERTLIINHVGAGPDLEWSFVDSPGLWGLPEYTAPIVVGEAPAGQSLADPDLPPPEVSAYVPTAPARHAGPDGLVLYGDRGVFDSDWPGLPVEDFENTLVPTDSMLACDGPFDSTTDNGCFAPGGILDGIRFQASPDNTGSLVVLTEGSYGMPSAVVGPVNISANYDILFLGGGVGAVGLDLFDPLNAQNVIDVYIHGPGDVLLGQTTFPVGATTPTFWGVGSYDQPITRIHTQLQFSSAELVDSVAFGGLPIQCGVDWASPSPTSSVTAPGDGTEVIVTLDSTGYAPGAYAGTLCIESNDATDPLVAVPLTMNVLGPATIDTVTWTTEGCQLTFDSTVSGEEPIVYSWNFGDGLGASTDADATFAFEAPGGCFAVTLDVDNGYGTDTWVDTVCATCKAHIYLPIVLSK